jgi:hypothetical protein
VSGRRSWAAQWCVWTALVGGAVVCLDGARFRAMEPAEAAGSTQVEMTDAAFSDVTAALTSPDTLPFFVEEVKNSDWCVMLPSLGSTASPALRIFTHRVSPVQVRIGAAADAHCLVGERFAAG